MNRIRTLAGRYPIVAVTVLVGLVVVGLLLSNHITAAQLLATAFALIIAVQTSIRMIKDLVRGHWGVDVLAVMAIVSTVAVGEYLAALVIVLMLSGARRWKTTQPAGPSGNSLRCWRERLRLRT